ncbi:MAG: SDR family NAD(P)-dependent oxidoreductase [Armatimonadota bacterium]
MERTAIVTGAGRGVGRSIALALARGGWRVALLARTAEQLEAVAAEARSAGAGASLPLTADVTDPAAWAAAVEAVEQELGPAELLVNNAGTFSAIGPLWEADPDAWWADVTVSLRGVQLGCRAVLPGMLARGRGRIVNVVGGGTFAPFPHGSGYAAGKAAVMRVTETLAAELEEVGSAVAVFAISPGLVRTRLTERQLTTPEGQRWMRRTREMFERGRDQPPERAGELVVALASGRFDRLAGRFFAASDDLETLLADEEEIRRKDRRTLRMR